MTDQLRPDGSLRHLLTLEGLRRALSSSALLERSQGYRAPARRAPPPMSQRARRHAPSRNLFTEPSTRTRVSLRARRQAPGRRGGEPRGAAVLARQGREHARHDLHARVAARGRVRDPRCGSRACRALVAANVAPHVSVLSAGEAHVSHPTQGLLDALTIRQQEAALRRPRGRDRRRHPPLARGALGLARAAHAWASRTCASSPRPR